MLLVFLLFQVLTCLGQPFSDISGECRYGREYTYDEAVDVATRRAQNKAIESVCYSEVSSFSIVDYKNDAESYKGNVVTNTSAEVFIKDKQVTTKRNKVIVSISGEVYACNPRRVATVKINNNVYYSNDVLAFNVSFYRNSYLKILWFDEVTGEGGKLYPIEDDRPALFVADGGYSFPRDTRISYISLICPWIMSPAQKWDYFQKYGKLPDQNIKEGNMPAPRNANHGTWGKPKHTANEKHITIVFVTTENNIPLDLQTIDRETFFNWWISLPLGDRDSLIKKHITLKV